MKTPAVRAAIAILFCLTLWCLRSQAGEISPEVVRKVQLAVVIVYVYDGAGKLTGQGSGFLFKTEGRLVTNYHVLGNAPMATIRIAGGGEYSVQAIVAEDKADDVIEAAVDVPASAVRCLVPAGTPPRPGDRVMVIGSPLGVERAVSEGSVIAIRDMGSGYGKGIVHSAHSFPGSSGSPLVNASGEVIGIESAGVAGKPDINFAVPLERFAGLSQTFRQLRTAPATAKAAPRGDGEEEAVRRDAQMAESGDPEAQVRLARRYEQGRGLGKSCYEALRWYRKAADGGFVQAQFHTGRMYYEGGCIGQNYAEAAKWLQKAAERGLPDAQKLMGSLSYNGDGVARDRVRACMWMILAASQKNEEARRMLGLMAAELTPDEIKAAQEQAKNWRPAR